MSLDENKTQELEAMLAKMGSGELSTIDKTRLNQLVSKSAAARRRYIQHCQMNAILRESCGLMLEISESSSATADREVSATGGPSPDEAELAKRFADSTNRKSWRLRLRKVGSRTTAIAPNVE